jgi:hypothetical protein
VIGTRKEVWLRVTYIWAMLYAYDCMHGVTYTGRAVGYEPCYLYGAYCGVRAVLLGQIVEIKGTALNCSTVIMKLLAIIYVSPTGHIWRITEIEHTAA